MYILFWIPILLATFIFYISPHSKVLAIGNISISFEKILVINTILALLMVFSGKIKRWVPLLIYFYNSIVFSITFSIFGDPIKAFGIIWKYGFTEILAFSMACYVGRNMGNISRKRKIIYIIAIVMLLLISGIIESAVIGGINESK